MSLRIKKRKISFFMQVYKVVKKIPAGKVATYGQIAGVIGTRDTRQVGWALHANKEGRLAPGYAFGGPNEQKNRLLAEGVKFIDETHVDLMTSSPL